MNDETQTELDVRKESQGDKVAQGACVRACNRVPNFICVE